jgi:hypothetical protein
MSEYEEVVARFNDALSELRGDPRSPLPGRNPGAFAALIPSLERGAESGDAQCQAALATLLGFGLACASETEFLARYHADIAKASGLWANAAFQGFWPAFDNLLVMGVGSNADLARRIAAEVEAERSELIGRYGSLPVYGPAFMREACSRYVAAVRRLTSECS